jgi:hypothetical protein
MRNAFRVRRRGRATAFAAIVGVVTAFLYVGLFAQAFSIVVGMVDLRGQLAVLALVTGTIAFGSLSARAASSEAVRAGTPENEFYLARPVSLHKLVAARGLADAVTDPVGGLFLLPVLIAATVVWRLGAVAWPIAFAISVLMQIGISTLAYAVQLAVVRYVPGRRRRMVWTGLRLVAALSLAMLWMLGTYVMRAPGQLATKVAGIAPVLAYSPAMLVSAPLAALVRGQTGHAVLGIVVLGGTVAAAMLLTVAIARRAGMAGWEEAGAVWAEATRAPAPTTRLPTAATKDLRLIVRDRSQLLALIAMPVIFIGVQVFGAAGWGWTTANLGRISCLAYSLALYMGTIGPLTHMQAERRAFWILRTVPVPLSQLLGAKARAWAVIVGGIAATVFAVMSLSVPNASVVERLGAGLLVTAGAAGMSFIAVAMASGGADLSDETSTAVGPSTIYSYLFVGGLFNLVLVEDGATRVAGLLLYGFAGWTYWLAGVEQAGFCLDAEVVRKRRLRASDGATMVILYAVGGRALLTGMRSVAGAGKDMVQATQIAAIGQLVLTLFIGLAASIYVLRRPARGRRGWAASLTIGAGAGALGAGVIRAVAGAGDGAPTGFIALLVAAVLVEEIVLRGIVQRALPVPPLAAAAITVIVGVVSAQVTGLGFTLGAAAVVALVISHMCGAFVYALTGRVAASWLARAFVVGVAAFT